VIGKTIGPFQIVAKLGEGGMGEVYRAHDTHLNRDVALKVLLDAVVGDPERVARFTREAHVLAALNHPHIAHVYGFEAGPPTALLVMELVEGPTLAEVIGAAPGGLPLDQVLPIARQIADALEAAHEHGIIHRDLKPANVKVRDDGVVKVLDFGLAKAMDPAASSGAEAMNSPTMTARATQMGVILGTAAYMAPEQAKGKAVDKRADVWAFGVVLYEMLTGRRLFDAEDMSETLAAVLRQEISLSALPATIPPRLARLLARCLERDPKQRLRDMGEARIEIARIEAGGADVVAAPAASVSVQPPAATTRRRILAIAGVTLLVGLAVTVTWVLMRPPSSAGVTRLSVLTPPGRTLYPDSASVAISPDGKMVAFVIGGYHSPSELWVRSLDSLTARHLEGTDGASLPFWSPDSIHVGYFGRGGELKKVAVTGGRAETICTLPGSPVGRGASWNASNVIVFATGTNGPIYRVSADRGGATPVTTIDAPRQSGHRFPVFLPDGDHFLYAALPAHDGKFDILAASLSGGTSTLVGAMESGPVYAEPGWLLYARQGVLAAQPFDARALRTTGVAVTLADEPTSLLDAVQSFTAGPTVSVSPAGSLAYFSAPAANATATWIEPSGKIGDTVKLPDGQYSDLRISPDGGRAVFVRSISVTEASLWLVNLARQGAMKISSGRGRNEAPVWSPDGADVAFASDRDGPQDFFVKHVADASPERPLYQSAVLFKTPNAWSRDGRWIIFSELGPDVTYDVWLLPVSGSAATGTPEPYLRGPGKDYLALPSPDGHRMAYVSTDTGRDELYVQSFPEPGQKQQISTDGVSARWWSSDSRRLWFVGGDRTLWRADVEPGATLRVSPPVRIGEFPPNIIAVDMRPDGSRFLALIAGTGSVTIVHNWRAALEKKR
jgi:Tol biopolymer transport system component